MRVGQADTRAFSNQVKSTATLTEVERTLKAEHYLQCLITARLVLMEHFAAHLGKRIGEWAHDACRRWLMVQMDGGTEVSKDLFLVLIRGERTVVDSIRQRCVGRLGNPPVFLFDEAHGWHVERTYGTYQTTGNSQAPPGERRTLFTRAVFILRELGFGSLWVGTALTIGDLRLVQSAVLKMTTDSLHNRIVAGFRALSPQEVEATLCHFLRVSGPTARLLSGELAGRGRTTSEFLAYCWRQGARAAEDVLACFGVFRDMALSVSERITGEPHPPEQARSLSDVWETLLLTNSAGTMRFARDPAVPSLTLSRQPLRWSATGFRQRDVIGANRRWSCFIACSGTAPLIFAWSWPACTCSCLGRWRRTAQRVTDTVRLCARVRGRSCLQHLKRAPRFCECGSCVCRQRRSYRKFCGIRPLYL